MCVYIVFGETMMTSRAPVVAVRYTAGLLMFVVLDSLQTDIDRREYQLVRAFFDSGARDWTQNLDTSRY